MTPQAFRGGGQCFSALLKTLATPKFLFWFFLFVYIFLGFYLSFDSKLLYKHNDIYFQMDTWKYLHIINNPNVKSGTIFKHPLYVFLMYPIIQLLKGVIHDKRLALIVFQALISSSINCMLFGILSKLSKDNLLSMLLTLIYGFAFSTLIFTGLFEAYIFSIFFMVLFFYYFICLETTDKKGLSLKDIFVAAFCGVGTFGLILSNVSAFFIAIIYPLKNMCCNIKQSLAVFLKILISFLTLTGVILLITKLCMPVTSYFFEYNGANMIKAYWGQGFSVKELLIQDFIAPFTSVNWTINPLRPIRVPTIVFDCARLKYIIPSIVFYLISFVLYFKNLKNFKHKFLSVIFLSILLLNFAFSLKFNSNDAFLFSQNYFYLIILLLGLVYISVSEKFKPFLYGFLSLFLGYQILANFYIISQIHKYVVIFDAVPKFNIFVMLLYSLLITFLIFILCLFIRKIISKDILSTSFDNKIFLGIVLFLLLSIISMSFYGMCWWRL